MFQLSKLTRATFRFRSVPRGLRVHFNGRSLVCPGQGCPLCDYETPRSRFYAIVDVRDSIDLLELPPSLFQRIQDMHPVRFDRDWLGIAVSVTRSKIRAEWSVNATKATTIEPAPAGALVEHVARLYRLPAPSVDVDWKAFAKMLGNAHAATIGRCVLPFSPQQSA